jgi:hypothetical protein
MRRFTQSQRCGSSDIFRAQLFDNDNTNLRWSGHNKCTLIAVFFQKRILSASRPQAWAEEELESARCPRSATFQKDPLFTLGWASKMLPREVILATWMLRKRLAAGALPRTQSVALIAPTPLLSEGEVASRAGSESGKGKGREGN